MTTPLPLELLQDIFELAACSDVSVASRLSTVCRTTHRWTEPLLFHTVILETPRALKAFLNAISDKPAGFVSARVKHLGIFTPGPSKAIARVLQLCAGVTSLACGVPLPPNIQLPANPLVSREQHLLGLSCRQDWDASALDPSVTHLRVHLTRSDWTPERLAQLRRLSSLTHMAVICRQSPNALDDVLPILQDILEHVPSLDILLVQVTGRPKRGTKSLVEELNTLASSKEPRLVAETAPFSVVRQWEDASRGTGGIWADAEVQVAKRRSQASLSLHPSSA